MDVTSIGHAGMLIETEGGSILCDPWFEPAFFGSWFPFPRNDQLSDDLLDRIEHADFLYISHLHGDHHDEAWLTGHLRRDIPILLPGFPTREQQRTLATLGFTEFIRTTDTVETEIAPGLKIAIHIESSITDGPGGDSALVVIADDAIVVNQNDCRTTDLAQLRSHGSVDLHWLQYSGAIWYPMVYEMEQGAKKLACDAKVDAQFARAMRYVETIGARAIAPSAGPPCFLDPDLFDLNVIDGSEASIFPDQTVFLDMLERCGYHGIMNIPGTTITVDGTLGTTHPMPDADVAAIFSEKRAYLDRNISPTGCRWLDKMKADWQPARPPTCSHDPEVTGGSRSSTWRRRCCSTGRRQRRAARFGARRLQRRATRHSSSTLPAAKYAHTVDEPFAFRFDIPSSTRRSRRLTARRRLVKLAALVVPICGLA